MSGFDIGRVRKDFPLLCSSSLAYLDNAATSQKPEVVLKAIEDYYKNKNANPMRGLYELSVASTTAYESARETVAEFINASQNEEIVFTRNASESLNLIAYSYGMNFLTKEDEVLVAITEHHSNLLPWQNVCRQTGASLKFLDCDATGFISEEVIDAAINKNTKLVALTHVSNVLGRKNPISHVVKKAHEVGAKVVLDAAQSVAHMSVDVRALDVDFLVFSGHKMLAPMGIGVLYAKLDLLNSMPPFLYGGEMIETVTRYDAVYAQVPHKFEAGTVNAGGAVGLEAAIKYIKELGFDAIKEREEALTKLAFDELADYDKVHILGSADYKEHHGIIAFSIDDVHPHDIAQILSTDDIAVRAGHHCAQPLLKHLGFMSTARASLAFYNTEEEVVRFTDSLKSIRRRMGYAK